MKFISLSRSALWFLISACSALALNAAEIEVQREAHVTNSLVRLADVAIIHCEEPVLAARLAAVELFPAPPVDGWVDLHNRDLFELLEIRGFDPLVFRLTGAVEVKVYGRQRTVVSAEPMTLPAEVVDATPVQTSVAPRRLPVAASTKSAADNHLLSAANNRFEGALLDYLRRSAGGNYQWELAFQLSAEEANLFSSGGLEISGGSQPYTGKQSFQVSVHRAEGISQRTVAVEVRLPSRVIAASRTLSAGDRLEATDLQWIVPAAASGKRVNLERLEEVVGMELTRGVAVGQALETDMLRRPILVQRNAVARLQVRSGGVVVGTKVRAMDEGAQGDQIRVQSLFDRQQFTATVVGPQEVEMIAGQ